MNAIFSFTTVLCLILLTASCVHYQPVAVSSTSLGGEREEPVATVTGTSAATYVFGIPSGDDSLAAAIRDARQQAPSDSMVNVFVDRRMTCFPLCGFPLVVKVETMVYGTLVRYIYAEPTESADVETEPASRTVADFDEVPEGARVWLFLTDGTERELLFQSIHRNGESIWVKPLDGGYFSPFIVPMRSIERVELVDAP